jgi:hypothetical protein
MAKPGDTINVKGLGRCRVLTKCYGRVSYDVIDGHGKPWGNIQPSDIEPERIVVSTGGGCQVIEFDA